jgi:hypothetical protein
MQQLACCIAILAVMAVYWSWRSYLKAVHRRRQLLGERVAYLLWVAADVDEPALVPAGDVFDNPLDMA